MTTLNRAVLALLPCLVLVLSGSASDLAGQPGDTRAGKKFEALKDRVAKIVESIPWSTDPHGAVVSVFGTVELARMTGPFDAKLTITFFQDKKHKENMGAFFIYLKFHGAAWTTTNLDVELAPGIRTNQEAVVERTAKNAARGVMRAIDKIGSE